MPLTRRKFLAHSGFALAALSLGACASSPAKPRSGPDAIVDASFNGKPGSLIAGTPTYKTVQEALDAAPVFGGDWQIKLRKGRYVEKLSITKSGIRLIGEDREQTIISFDAYAGQVKPSGGFWGTEGSATLSIRASDFSAENLSIENSFDYLANMARDRNGPDFIRGSQALAVFIGGQGADRSSFRNVNLLGYQDTLCPMLGRSYYENCLIAGNVDFIFGGGQAWFEACELRSRPAGYVTTKVGYLTAPSTSLSKKYGFAFNRCRLTREAGVPDATCALGRPWHPNGDPQAVGQSIFIDCWMDAHITTDGWDSMGGTSKSGERVTFLPEDSRFFEHQSSGPGVVNSAKRRQLSAAQLAETTRDKVLDGWKP